MGLGPKLRTRGRPRRVDIVKIRGVQLNRWPDPPGKSDRTQANPTTPVVSDGFSSLESDLGGLVLDLLPKTRRNPNRLSYIAFSSEIF